MQALQAAKKAQTSKHPRLPRVAETKGKRRRKMDAGAALARHPRRPTGWTMNRVRGRGCTYRHAPHRSLWVHLSAGGVRRAVTIAPHPTSPIPRPRPSSFHHHQLLPRTPGNDRVCRNSVLASTWNTCNTCTMPLNTTIRMKLSSNKNNVMAQ